jgi:hypothetical protein
MLFDLRSRSRRRTVRVVYMFLALVMVAGLVLVGVGTGGSQGGLLNAFTNNGSGGGASQVYVQQVQQAVKAVKKHPNSATDWASLAQARWGAAGSGSNYDTTTDTYTKTGKKQLSLAASAWTRYVTLIKDKPSPELSQLAAGIYQNLGQWKNEANAWNFAVASQPKGSATALKPYLCLALSSYAAGQTAKGQLAANAAIKLTPKLQKLTLQSSLKSAKTDPTGAQTTLAEEC